uniref:Uncharacterized protein n=1 Tax=Suricata suricatta TaxID=37032 RepID=A0A673V217_SURSU
MYHFTVFFHLTRPLYVPFSTFSFFTFFFCTGLQHVAISHLPVALLETFELGPTLLRRPEEAALAQPLGHGPVHLAVPRTSLQRFIKARLLENREERLRLLVAPVHHTDNVLRFSTTELSGS